MIEVEVEDKRSEQDACCKGPATCRPPGSQLSCLRWLHATHRCRQQGSPACLQTAPAGVLAAQGGVYWAAVQLAAARALRSPPQEAALRCAGISTQRQSAHRPSRPLRCSLTAGGPPPMAATDGSAARCRRANRFGCKAALLRLDTQERAAAGIWRHPAAAAAVGLGCCRYRQLPPGSVAGRIGLVRQPLSRTCAVPVQCRMGHERGSRQPRARFSASAATARRHRYLGALGGAAPHKHRKDVLRRQLAVGPLLVALRAAIDRTSVRVI
jgi:hypothetical protein